VRKLLASAWLLSLASMAGYLGALMLTMLWLDKAGGATAERAALVLLVFELLLCLASIVGYGWRTAAFFGQPRWIAVILFALWQLAILAAAAFVSLVALNR